MRKLCAKDQQVCMTKRVYPWPLKGGGSVDVLIRSRRTNLKLLAEVAGVSEIGDLPSMRLDSVSKKKGTSNLRKNFD